MPVSLAGKLNSVGRQLDWGCIDATGLVITEGPGQFHPQPGVRKMVHRILGVSSGAADGRLVPAQTAAKKRNSWRTMCRNCSRN